MSAGLRKLVEDVRNTEVLWELTRRSDRPGYPPWPYRIRGVCNFIEEDCPDEVAEYVAAASPQAILALFDEVDAWNDASDESAREIDRYRDRAEETDRELKGVGRDVERLMAERDRLRGERDVAQTALHMTATTAGELATQRDHLRALVARIRKRAPHSDAAHQIELFEAGELDLSPDPALRAALGGDVSDSDPETEHVVVMREGSEHDAES